MRVAVLGASPKPERYSNKAVRDLVQHGHEVVPVNPGYKTIEGLTVARTLADAGKVDTVTVYIGPDHIGPLIPAILAANPKRVIANPGAESTELAKAVKGKGIEYIEACTLVMLRTGTF